MTTTTAQGPAPAQGKLFGHPTGLFTLFFAEMWERFSFYGMRALLLFYMAKGFLRYDDDTAYGVYAAYGSLVYMAPYFGGMIADRVLGQRRAVVLGGLLMAMGHLAMTQENKLAFFGGLALLICGNGFFKPNISTIVGSLYPGAEAAKKDAGFTLFYMGINLGAAVASILCAAVGAAYGPHYGFGLATIGMFVGLAVFVVPTRVAQALIILGALATCGGMLKIWDSYIQLAVRVFLSIALMASAIIAFVALGRGGLPKEAGAPVDKNAPSRKLGGVLRADIAVYIGTVFAVVVFYFLVQRKPIADVILYVTGGVALAYILYEAIVKSTLIERHRLFVVVILMFFSMLFWAFFEQAGSSINNFTDRNIDMVPSGKVMGPADEGSSVSFRVLQRNDDHPDVQKLPLLSQAQLGYENGDTLTRERLFGIIKSDADKSFAEKEAELADKPKELEEARTSRDKFLAAAEKEPLFTMTSLSAIRGNVAKKVADKEAVEDDLIVVWKVTPQNAGMKVSESEIPAAEFQAANPIFILLFGLVFTGIWSWLSTRGREPSTTVKFALGLLQLGLGFLAFWYGAKTADTRGMTSMTWLLLGYLLHTTGELCISPVGLSMVTKLSPARLASTVMGAWFLATAFSHSLAGAIAKLTSVSGDEGGGFIPPPSVTVGIYGNVFFQIGVIACISALICFVLSPLLTKWMHPEAEPPGSLRSGGGH